MTAEQTYEKDYSLLRPINKATLKPGDTVCYKGDGSLGEYLGPYIGGEVGCDCCIRWIDASPDEEIRVGDCVVNSLEYFRQAPLCWSNERPIYPGDVLYWKPENRKIVAKHDLRPGWLLAEDDGAIKPYLIENLTWKAPKKQYFVNLYKDKEFKDRVYGYSYPTRERADCCATNENGIDPNRIDCVMIEVEE